jgi:hypothetical protein
MTTTLIVAANVCCWLWLAACLCKASAGPV